MALLQRKYKISFIEAERIIMEMTFQDFDKRLRKAEKKKNKS